MTSSLTKSVNIANMISCVHCTYCLDIAKQMSFRGGQGRQSKEKSKCTRWRICWELRECMCTFVSAYCECICTFCPATVNSFKSALDSPRNRVLLVLISHPSALKYHAVTWGKKVFRSVWEDYIEMDFRTLSVHFLILQIVFSLSKAP